MKEFLTELELSEMVSIPRSTLRVTMKAMGHGSARMMMRYQHPEYVEAVRRVINRRNEAVAGTGLGQLLGRLK